MTRNMILDGDRPTIGNRHGSVARSVSAKGPQLGEMQHGEILNLSSITGPFFIEVFSGSGRLAAAIRINGHTAYEFDITKKGGRITYSTRRPFTSSLRSSNTRTAKACGSDFPAGRSHPRDVTTEAHRLSEAPIPTTYGVCLLWKAKRKPELSQLTNYYCACITS